MRKAARSLVLIAAAHLAVAPVAYSTQSFALAGDVQLPNPSTARMTPQTTLPPMMLAIATVVVTTAPWNNIAPVD